MHDLVVFSHLRWDVACQRPHQLLSRLATQRRVIFVEEPVFAPRAAGWHQSSPCEGVVVLCPHTPVQEQGLCDAQTDVLGDMVRDQLQAMGVANAVAWFCSPMAFPLLQAVPAKVVVYDCMDACSAFDVATTQVHAREVALLKVADIVLTGEPSRFEAKLPLHPNVHCYPGALDAEAIRALVDAAAGDAHSATWAPDAVPVDHVIVGAGPTGLAAAHYLCQLAPRASTLLLERQTQVGGWCRSVVDKGFTFDYAGHVMFSTDPEVLRLYTLLLGDNVHWQNREAWIYSKEVYTRYPFQGAMFGLPPPVLKECLLGAIDAHSSASPTPENENFEDFIHRVWGRGVAKHFAVPYNEKLWAVPLRGMETSWVGGRVPLPDIEQMIDGALKPVPAPMGPDARFGYPLHGGFQALMDGFVPLIEGTLNLGCNVLSVWPQKRWVRTNDGRTLRYGKLVSTMPLPKLVEACGAHAPQEVRDAALALQHVSVRCVNLGVARAGLTNKHWIYYPEDTVFHRIFVQGNASPHNQPEGAFALTCEITYSPAKPLPAEGQALVDLCIADAKRVGLLRPDDTMRTTNQVDMPCAYVVYDHARAANVAVIRDWLCAFDVILAGQYSEWAYYNADHAFMAGRRAAQECMATQSVKVSSAELSAQF
jgi:protoporphyrinogen oxidase